jgi:lysophospholipase-3
MLVHHHHLYLLLLAFAVGANSLIAPNESRLSPVILVPGDGGSRLEAKLDKKDVAHHYCERKSDDWFDLWVNLSLLVPFAIDCWVEK